MAIGFGTDFMAAKRGATPQFAQATATQGDLDAAEAARIDALRSSNLGAAGEAASNPWLQDKAMGMFGGGEAAATAMPVAETAAGDMAATAATDAITNQALGTVGGTALGTAAAPLASTAATDAIMAEALGTALPAAAAPAAATGGAMAGLGAVAPYAIPVALALRSLFG